jgi:hypothetical protein
MMIPARNDQAHAQSKTTLMLLPERALDARYWEHQLACIIGVAHRLLDCLRCAAAACHFGRSFFFSSFDSDGRSRCTPPALFAFNELHGDRAPA